MHRAALTLAAGSAALTFTAVLIDIADEPTMPAAPATAHKGDRLNAPPVSLVPGRWAPLLTERWAALAPTATDDRREASAQPLPEEPAPAPTHRRPPVRREICSAHGMRREYYRRGGWQYWRCSRP